MESAIFVVSVVCIPSLCIVDSDGVCSTIVLAMPSSFGFGVEGNALCVFASFLGSTVEISLIELLVAIPSCLLPSSLNCVDVVVLFSVTISTIGASVVVVVIIVVVVVGIVVD